MPKAIVAHETGGPEVLRWQDVQIDAPGRGEARLRHTAIGLNYVDVYFRTGLYPLPGMPVVLGMEAAGIVEAVGPEVGELKPGDRVAYAATPAGAYAEERVMPADRLVTLPEDIDDHTAAAAMLKGMTAEYLLHRTHHVRTGEIVLVHAAAGGVGLLLDAWARHLGATVIGTVGSDDKAALAKAHGCHHTIVYSRENFVDRVKEITEGRGVDVAYDSVGKDTFAGSLECLALRGHLISFGQSSGAVEPLQMGLLGAKSATVSRPSLFHYTLGRAELLAMANNLFDAIRRGIIRIGVNQHYPLRDAATAHSDLEARRTTGSTVLIP